MSNSNGHDPVLLTARGAVSVITFNRPDRLNAVDEEMHFRIVDRLREADRDPATRVIVVTGAGRGFCAGGDVKGMAGSDRFFGRGGRTPVLTNGRDLVDAFVRAEKPVISMVNGPAIGLGATMALLGDIVVMAEEAKIADRHVNVGLVAGDGGGIVWPMLIGFARAKEYLLTGRVLSGTEAASIGLVSRAVPGEFLEETVFGIASELASLPPYAVQGTKSAVNRIIEVLSGIVLDTSLAYEHLSMATADHQEAVAAWQEKRAGNYVGR